MSWSANEVERRVLGVLMEKSLAQPDYYPMTLNAVVNACNQKQNRHPIMDLDEDQVYNALESLRERSVVMLQLPGAGSRTRKYRHEVATYFSWTPLQQAVMAELLIRGPQTQGELRQRANRMRSIDSVATLQEILDELSKTEPPCVTVLPKQPGQSAIRYAQTLYDEPEDETRSPAPPMAAEPASPVASHTSEESDSLREEVAELREQLADVTRRLESLERLME